MLPFYGTRYVRLMYNFYDTMYEIDIWDSYMEYPLSGRSHMGWGDARLWPVAFRGMRNSFSEHRGRGGEDASVSRPMGFDIMA